MAADSILLLYDGPQSVAKVSDHTVKILVARFQDINEAHQSHLCCGEIFDELLQGFIRLLEFVISLFQTPSQCPSVFWQAQISKSLAHSVPEKSVFAGSTESLPAIIK